MTTIREYLQYLVHNASQRIFNLKQEALKEPPPVDEKGRPIIPHYPHMSPRSKDWDRYRTLKRECSLWLTMLSIVKRAHDSIPTKAEAVKLFHSQPFANHARKGRPAKSLYFKAFRRLQKIGNRLESDVRAAEPGISMWKAERQAALEKRQEVAHAAV